MHADTNMYAHTQTNTHLLENKLAHNMKTIHTKMNEFELLDGLMNAYLHTS